MSESWWTDVVSVYVCSTCSTTLARRVIHRGRGPLPRPSRYRASRPTHPSPPPRAGTGQMHHVARALTLTRFLVLHRCAISLADCYTHPGSIKTNKPVKSWHLTAGCQQRVNGSFEWSQLQRGIVNSTSTINRNSLSLGMHYAVGYRPL